MQVSDEVPESDEVSSTSSIRSFDDDDRFKEKYLNMKYRNGNPMFTNDVVNEYSVKEWVTATMDLRNTMEEKTSANFIKKWLQKFPPYVVSGAIDEIEKGKEPKISWDSSEDDIEKFMKEYRRINIHSNLAEDNKYCIDKKINMLAKFMNKYPSYVIKHADSVLKKIHMNNPRDIPSMDELEQIMIDYRAENRKDYSGAENAFELKRYIPGGGKSIRRRSRRHRRFSIKYKSGKKHCKKSLKNRRMRRSRHSRLNKKYKKVRKSRRSGRP
jgi:hypothetical protein